MKEHETKLFKFLQRLIAIKKKHCIKYRETDEPKKFRAITKLYDDIIKEYNDIK